MKKIFSINSKLSLTCLLLLAMVLSLTIIFSSSVSAVSGSDFKAGRIIDDSIFTNKSSMTVGQIQQFLNAKMPTCDTWGNGTYNGVNKAAYARSKGVLVPFTCLKDYYENPSTHANNLTKVDGQVAPIPAGALSAAQLIYNVGQQYNINPQVLIDMLEKEEGLVQDDWPWPFQYRSAVGYGCPDGADCDGQYYGFYNQISSASWQFNRYAAYPNQYNYVAGTNNFIQWNPNSGCGGSNVFIQNQATAGLYNYTPYQPNQAALNNLYGSGDSCSAYGNRNFWRLFNDWFGPSTSPFGDLTMNNVQQSNPNPARGETVTYTYTLTNTLSVPITLDAVGLVGRLGSITGPNRDYGWQGPVTIQPHATQQFTFSTTLHDSGVMFVWPAALYQGGYIQYNNWGEQMNIHEPNISLTSPLAASNPNPLAGQTVTFTATAKNNEPQPINMQAIGIPIRYYGQYNYDVAWTTPSGSSIAAGASVPLSGSIVLDKPGPYTAWVSGLIAGQYTNLSPNLSLNVAAITPKFGITYLETPNATPALGEDVVVKFKLKNNSGTAITLDNVGVAGRYGSPNSPTNNDFGWSGPVAFADGEEKSFTTFASNVSQLKNFYAWAAINYHGSYTFYDTFVMSPHSPNLTTPSPININNGTKPVVGQTVPVTVTVKNNEPRAIRFAALGIPVRFYGVYNYDAVWQGSGTLAPSGQSGDTIALSGTILFDKPGPYTVWTSINLLNGGFYNIGGTVSLNL